MYLSKLCIAGVLTSALWIGGAAAGERLEAHRIKTCTPDGVCYPNRQAYGFYQTQWRKWPGAEFAAAEKVEPPIKAPETLPPPRKAPGQDTLPGGDSPGDAMDEPLPGDDNDTMQPPPGDSDPIDTQPALPGDLPRTLPQPRSDTDLRDLFKDDAEETTPATPKTPATTAPEEESPTEMPAEEDDPFKDEPPGDPNNETGMRSRPQSPTNQRADDMRWRNAPALAVKAASGDSESPEPRLLRSTAGRQGVRKSPTTSHFNPLRAASATVKPKAPRPQKVVPTAEWSAQAEESAAANLWRNNPLRVR